NFRSKLTDIVGHVYHPLGIQVDGIWSNDAGCQASLRAPGSAWPKRSFSAVGPEARSRRPSARPSSRPTGSPTKRKTIGIVVVAFRAAMAAGVLNAMIASNLNLASVPIPKFAFLCGTLVCELRNPGTLASL